MRRCVPLGTRTLAYNNAKGFICRELSLRQSSASFGGPAVCTFTELDASRCEEERGFGVPNTFHNKDYSLRASIRGQVLNDVNLGRLEFDPSFYCRLLKQCAELGDLGEGRMLHAHVLKSEFKDHVKIHNNIVYMYAKCGSLDEAQKFFGEMPCKDSFTWTAMINAYSQNGMQGKALSLFPQMLYQGLRPNKFTFSSLLKASVSVSSDKLGMQMHALCVKCGCDSSVYVGTALLDTYARCGHMNEAKLIFDRLEGKNEASWNALIAGHIGKDEEDEALKLFQKMKSQDFEPDDFTYSSVLSSCARSGTLEQGKWIHAHVIKSGVKLVKFVGHTLLHMYAKCGSIQDAIKVFIRLRQRNVVSWNSMLTGFAQHGLGQKALEQFEAMLRTRIQPNSITFLCVLTACSHAGLVEQGKHYLNMMKNSGLEPMVEHYVTFVDLLGRAGKLDEALRFITEMPIEPVAEIWKALLCACRMHKNMELGAYAAGRVFELDPQDPGPYVILSNIYASAGRKSDVANVRKMMKDCSLRKEPACSWVEIENTVHVFVADDFTHPQIKEIYEAWDCISAKIKDIGYVPDSSHVLLFVDEHEREANLQRHSEKLALAFACLTTPPNSTIRIKKNIRICGDCHSAIKLTSKVLNRDIIVRDTNRFHHFQNGSCSCGDYW